MSNTMQRTTLCLALACAALWAACGDPDGSGNNVSSICGNGVAEANEQCDGNDMTGQSCVSLGYAGGGRLLCDVPCLFDTSHCDEMSVCGNGRINVGEDCDGNDLDGRNCGDYGFGAGTLGCSSACRFEQSGCYTCGNGELEGAEACDGTNFGTETCATQTTTLTEGSLACTEDCLGFNTSDCHSCGNGVTDPGENCDDGNYTPGDGCGPTCMWEWCGNGYLDPGEECDYGESNSDHSPDACRTDCRLPWCGDGVVDSGEQCDDGNTAAGDGCSSSCQIE